MEQYNEKYTVDFKDVRYYDDIHNALKEGLELPEYYGGNLDALLDCLTDFIDNDVEIILNNYQDMEKLHKEYAGEILDVFHDAKHWADDAYAGARIIVERDGVVTEIE